MVPPGKECHTGLLSRRPFMKELTGKDAIAKACRELARGCHKSCPAAYGHLPGAYEVGTVAPGLNGTFWVNAYVKRSKITATSTQPEEEERLEWVPADPMMVCALVSIKKRENELKQLIMKEYKCLEAKERMTQRPPCSELETLNTSAAVEALQNAAVKLKRKGLNASQCMALAGSLGGFDSSDDDGMYFGRSSHSYGSKKRRGKKRRGKKRRSNSPRSKRSRSRS